MTDAVAPILEGLGISAPPNVVTNDDYAAVLDTSDEWIRSRTGIRERRVAAPDVATSDLAVEAGERALKSAGCDEVDLVVLATTTPDRIVPNTAPEVASRLGMRTTPAFDINAACSGFVYGLATVSGLLAAGVAERVLLIGAETLHRFGDPEDRGTVVLFGDGAGAVVVRQGAPSELGTIGPFDLGSQGEYAELLSLPAGGSRMRATRGDIPRQDHYIHMDGREVYRHAVSRMVASSRAALERAGWRTSEVDRFVGHQANGRILDAVADRLDIPSERRSGNIDRYGNTSAASIPMALAEADLEAGERVLITAFGAGFTWGSTTITWPQLTPVS